MRAPVIVVLVLLWSATHFPAQAQTTAQIRLNQIGFYPTATKTAIVVDAPSTDFFVLTAGLADTVFSGTLGASKTWSPAQESVRQADFSELMVAGEFVIAVPGLGNSYPFEIHPNVHQEVARAAIKAYYFQRASTALEPSFAGRWTRAAGHPDSQVIVHPSAASAGRPAGTIISAPKGWYDAGDYNKYIVNSGISVGTLLMLYEHHPDYFDALETNIPETGDDVPDLLDEALWNIRWMLKMQDPGDGGVYHKLTTPNFEGAVMPNQANQPRYVVQKGTAATLDFAAVMALGARIFDDFESEFPGLADSMLTAARNAWNWAQTNPEVRYSQSAVNQKYNPDINTGEYGDGSFFDEFRWAAAELFITTQSDSFMGMYPPFEEGNLAAPGWPNVGTMAFISLAHHRENVTAVIDTAEVEDRLVRLANEYLNVKRDAAYDMVMGRAGDFYWGSNSLAGNQGIVLLQAYELTGDDRYLDAALSNLDYLLGRNGTGFSFVTGHGDKTPMNPHHRPSQSDSIHEPVPGFLVGGPNPGRQDGCTYPSTLPAKSYLDSWCSYASNEVAINWNAPLAYLAGAMEAIMSPTGLPVSVQRDGHALPPADPRLGLDSYPNPATDSAHVRFVLNDRSNVVLRAFDLLGREVSQPIAGTTLPAGAHDAEIDVSGWPAGYYLIRLEAAGSVFTRPLIVVR